MRVFSKFDLQKIKVFFGPMSKNVVIAISSLNSTNRSKLALLPSRRQVDFNGGYVGWDTESFVNSPLVKDRLVVARDHSGPSQGLIYDNGFESLRGDILGGINIVHIDPWKDCSGIDEAIDMTASMIEFCDQIRPNIYFEVGTEQTIFNYSIEDLNTFLSGLRIRISSHLFDKIVFCVVQSGTNVSALSNIGEFDKNRSTEFCELVESYGVFSKEHNCDYLSSSELFDRANCGVSAFNFAPELGVCETRHFIKSIREYTPWKLTEFFDLCYESGLWKKWVPDANSHGLSKEDIAIICGHYLAFSDFTLDIKKSMLEDHSFCFDSYVQEHIATLVIKRINEVYYG